MTETAEQAAHNELLRRCRATYGWVMRYLPGGALGVLSLAESEHVPGGHIWERQDRRISVGPTWTAVLRGLPV